MVRLAESGSYHTCDGVLRNGERIGRRRMGASVQLAISVGVPTLAVLVGILINDSRMRDLRSQMDRCFANIDRCIDDANDTLRAELRRVEGTIDARLKRLEDS